MDPDRRRPPGNLAAYRAPWLVLTTSLLLTVIAAGVVAHSARERDESRFRNAVQGTSDRIVGRISVYIASLRGGAALFAASDSVTRDDFRRYVGRLDLQRSFPGIQGMGYSERTAAALADSIDERHAIRYLEPLDERNERAIGFDMYGEAKRRAAMRRARDLGEPSISGVVRLVQEIDRDTQPGFLIYLPVYAGGDIPATVEERRERLHGYVYAPFRANDLFAGIFGSEQYPRASFTVYDGPTIDDAALLFRSPRAEGHEPALVDTTRLDLAGRTWTVIYESQPEFESGSRRGLVPLGIMIGLLFSAWLFGLAYRLSRAREVAIAASQAKSAFLANMSHELRTPLNAIGGYADLMLLGIPDPPSPGQREYLVRVQRAQQHLLTLINDVLSFARLEAGRVAFRLEPSHVPSVVRDAAGMIEGAATAAGLVLRVTEGPDVWVSGDEEKVRQIVLNLLSNALKFTEQGGSIDVGWTATDEQVAIAVRDSGIGIEPAQWQRIFEAFVQVDDDLTRQRQGTGLGLSISRSLARGLGGDITLESRPGVGSTFTLTLPRAAAQEH